MMRFSVLKREEMNAEQRDVYEVAERNGAPVGGPYWAFIRNPKFMRLSQDMGTYLRSCPLSGRERLIVALAVIRHWGSNYPWAVQVERALAEGVTREIIDAINARQVPVLTDPREKAAYELASELMATRGVRQATYAAAEKALGLAHLVDVMSTIGFFSMMCCTSIAFDIPAPDSAPARLAP